DDIALLRARHGDGPADAGAEGVEQRCYDRVECGRHGHQHAVGRQVLVSGIAAPQPGGLVDGDVAVHVGHAVPLTAAVCTRPARVALPAGQKDFDGDTVAGVHVPPFSG